MDYIKRNGRRILTDAAGYGLVILGIALGWVPGPGGIPLIIAGLGLLSINNAWAERLRKYLLDHGGKVVQVLFPPNRFVQWLYDGLVAVLLIVATILAIRHAAIWQISLAAAGFFAALAIAFLNRGRYERLKRKR